MRKLIIGSVVVLIVVPGAWFALGTSAGARQPSARPAMTQVQGTATVGVAHTTPGTSKSQSAALKPQSSNEIETSGEAGSETGTESEAENTSETGGANETDGHEDPDGVDANHQCPPNCDTATGEAP